MQIGTERKACFVYVTVQNNLVFHKIIENYLPSENQVIAVDRSGPSCSKLKTSLVNVSLKFQTLISEIRQYSLLKNCVKLLHCKTFSPFLLKISVYLVIKS